MYGRSVQSTLTGKRLQGEATTACGERCNGHVL